MKKTMILRAVLALALSTTASPATRLVPGEYPTIQDAIDASIDGDVVIVEPGTYTGDGNRDIDFLGKAIAVRSIDPNDPNIVAATIIDCNGSEAEPHRGFCFRTGEGQNSILEGLTVQNGFADDGAAIFCWAASPIIANCVIRRNAGSRWLGSSAICSGHGSPQIVGCVISNNSGAGIWCRLGHLTVNKCIISKNSGGSGIWAQASLTVSNSVITRNSGAYGGGICMEPKGGECTVIDSVIADNSAYAQGGGIHFSSSLTIIRSTISGNSAAGRHPQGGGIYGCGDATITNCIIRGNSVEGPRAQGGGIYAWLAHTFITNSIITDNQAHEGGAIYATGCATLCVLNCTFVNNSASEGSAVTHVPSGWCAPISLEITNSILWNSGPEIHSSAASITAVTYSNIRDGYPGQGNIDIDPGFALSGDYHLMPGSPCIDAGTNTPIYDLPPTDIEGNPRVLHGDGDGNSVVDMGAYEHDPSGPSIALVPRALSFHAVRGQPRPEPQTVNLRNCGSQTLRWQIVEDSDWLEVSPTTGVSNAHINTLTVTVDHNHLPRGDYACTLAIVDSDATNSPQPIQVTLRVGESLLVPHQYPTIQQAINAAFHGDVVIVEPGTYTGQGNRDIDFLGKAITVRSIDPKDPNIVAATVIDCNASEADPHRGFYFHNHEDAYSVLCGLTVIRGYAAHGAGISCRHSAPRIWRCTIKKNVSTGWGAGIHCSGIGGLTISQCTIAENSGSHAVTSGSGQLTIEDSIISNNRDGGGISADAGTLIVTNCVITGNSGDTGGGVYCFGLSVSITSCRISCNSAARRGGAFCFEEHCGAGKASVTNCVILGNTAQNGAGLSLRHSEPTRNAAVTGCTIIGNSARDNGGGIFSYMPPGGTQIRNCIVWSNFPDQIVDQEYPRVCHTDVQGGWPGEGNIDLEPCFVEPGYWADVNDPNIVLEPNDPNAVWIDGDYHLLAGSPCINAGDPNFAAGSNETDIDGQPRVFAGRVDMGADEFTPSLECGMKFTPQTFNPCSQGNWVKAHCVVPAEYGLEDVDVNSPLMIIEPVRIETHDVNVFVNEEGMVEIHAAFDRLVFCSIPPGNRTVTAIGSFTDGRNFYGTDTIRIITGNLKCLADFASHWLQADCAAPDWCDGFDMDHDSKINFIDFALSECCSDKTVE
ncbi:MAG: right-handed parallel beta-helix repeat-containing protein [Planctomycetota bacterium]